VLQVLKRVWADDTKVYSLESYKRIAVIAGHRGSVLALCLSDDEKLLFSSAGDRFVNVRHSVRNMFTSG